MKEKLKFLNSVVKKQYKYLLILVVATMIYVFLNLLQPIILGFIIDNVINLEKVNNPILENFFNLFGGVTLIRKNLWLASLLIIIIAVLSSVFVFIRSRLNGFISENIAFTIKNKMFDQLMHLPYSYYMSAQTGDLIQRSTSDIDTIRRMFAGQVSEFLYALFIVIISFSIMFQKNTKLTLIAASLLPVIFVFAILFFSYMRKVFLNYEEKESILTAYVSENLGATRVIKAFNRETYESKRFDKINRDLSEAGKKLINALGFYWGLSDFICFLSIMLVLVNGVLMVRSSSLSVGDAFVFTSYTMMMVWPLRQMGRIIADMSKVSVSIERINEVLSVEQEDLEKGLTDDINGDIVLENVNFAYADDLNTNVLNNLSLEIKKGESVAILGPTGSGKSSLLHLLLGLYDYSSGSIKLNGVELKDISKKHLRNNVSVVLQEPFLFSKSIKDNIMISKDNANLEQLRFASNIAHVDDFINNFDLGYDTLIGEKGTTLSGGQKQRVAIARTVVNDYPILIFDDSLSAVDTETDAKIREKLNNVKKDTTTIIITQRIASSKDADKIFVIENGEITQSGNHESLLKEEGLYKRVNKIQSESAGDLNE